MGKARSLLPMSLDAQNSSTHASVQKVVIGHSSGDHRLCDTVPEGMLEAIASLPSYVQRSNIFIVLAPPCQHADLGTLCDVSTWHDRGWCNLEFFCSITAPVKHDTLFVQSAVDVIHGDSVQAWTCRPGKGKFAVETDRALIAPIMASVIDSKILSLRTEDPFSSNIFQAWRSQLMEG